jgi:hypothetical protein
LKRIPEKEVCDLTMEKSADINVSTGAGSSYLDKLIEEEHKQEGRKKKLKSLKLE